MAEFLQNISAWFLARGFTVRALLCFMGGMLGALALAPISWPILFFPGFILTVFYLRHSANWKQGFVTGFFYALGFHLAGLYWISASLFIDIARYAWVLPFSLLALPAWLALLFAMACLAAHPLRARPLAHAVFLSGMIFFSEVARGTLLTGFPWNLFGTIWAETLPLAQSVSLLGIYGLTFFTLLAATLSSLLFERFLRPALLAVVLSWGLLSGLALWGEMRLEHQPVSYEQNVQLRIVQPGITQVERRTRSERLATLSRLAQLSVREPGQKITHLLWPETAVPDFLDQEPELRKSLARLVPKGGALIAGTPGVSIRNHKISYSNSLAVLSDKGVITDFYDKHHLVPFGEFIPLRGFLKVVPLATDVIGSRADFTPGSGPRTLHAPGFPSFSPLICYEAIFSGGVINRIDPPQLLLQITNDAWFGDTSGPYQHLAQARLRAIEEGLPLVRAANSGISAVIDPLGRVTASLPLDQTGTLDTPLPAPLREATLFSRFGNWTSFVLALLFSLLSGIQLFWNPKRL